MTQQQMQDLRVEAKSWVLSMEQGTYPQMPFVIDPSLKAEVAHQIRERLAEGSEWTRKFLFEHASTWIKAIPELHDELNALTRVRNPKDYIHQLDEWAISVWQRFPLQQGELIS